MTVQAAKSDLIQNTTVTSTTKESEKTDFDQTLEEVQQDEESIKAGEMEIKNAAQIRKEKYLAEHEADFIEMYPLYEKYKDVFTPAYSSYTREKANKILKELDARFPDFSSKREIAMHGGTEEEKEEFKTMQKEYFSYNMQLVEKYDLQTDYAPMFIKTPEAVKAYNFAVYEQLEQGVGVESARWNALDVARVFDGGEGMAYMFRFFLGGEGSMDDVMEAQKQWAEEIDYDNQIDLREYGFDHNFEWHNYAYFFGNDKEGIAQRIRYDLELFTFLTMHEEIVDQRLEELRERNPYSRAAYDENYDKNLKERIQKSYDRTILAKTVYDKYADKIFSPETTASERVATPKVESSRFRIQMSTRHTYHIDSESFSLSNALQSAGV